MAHIALVASRIPLCPGGHVPEPDDVVTPARDHGLAIGGEGEAFDPMKAPFDAAKLLASGSVPQSDHGKAPLVVVVTRGQDLAIARESDRTDITDIGQAV